MDVDMDVDKLATINATASYLSVHRSTVYDMIGKGELPIVLVGMRMRISTSALREYTASHTHQMLPEKRV